MRKAPDLSIDNSVKKIDALTCLQLAQLVCACERERARTCIRAAALAPLSERGLSYKFLQRLRCKDLASRLAPVWLHRGHRQQVLLGLELGASEGGFPLCLSTRYWPKAT